MSRFFFLSAALFFHTGRPGSNRGRAAYSNLQRYRGFENLRTKWPFSLSAKFKKARVYAASRLCLFDFQGLCVYKLLGGLRIQTSRGAYTNFSGSPPVIFVYAGFVFLTFRASAYTKLGGYKLQNFVRVGLFYCCFYYIYMHKKCNKII